MNKIGILFLCFIFSSAISARQVFSHDKEIDTVIALHVVSEYLNSGDSTEMILTIGQYAGGKYLPVSHWDNVGKEMISQRKTIFDKYGEYTVFKNGIPIKSIKIKETAENDFYCSSLVVGKGSAKALVPDLDVFTSSVSSTVSSGGIGGYYKTTYYLSINSNSIAIATQDNSTPQVRNFSRDEIIKLSDFARSSLLKKNSALTFSEIYVPEILAYDFDSDGTVEYVVTAKVENERTKLSGIFVLRYVDGLVTASLENSLVNRPSSWGNGYTLLDVLDLDGDNIPELIFETQGYEGAGFEIYKFKNGDFFNVFDETIYGC